MAIKSKPAQSFIPIKDVRDGVVVLKDGSMRMILMASSINFALKSEEEQAAILVQFQDFLNSLEFSTQIFIQSRRLDIKPYLAILNDRLKSQLSDLMRIQIEEYMAFIKDFTESANIMTKTFFIVIPYTREKLSISKKSSFLGGFLSKNKQDTSKEEKEREQFEEVKSQLEQRANVIKQGLARTGVRVVPLDTDEIIELYYKLLNPGLSERPVKKDE